jgi:hypothetical protein
VTTPVRIQLSRRKGFNLQTHSKAINGLPAVNVSRPGPWGNPFIVGKHGDREYCVQLYRYLMAGYLAISLPNTAAEQARARKHVAKHRHQLRGKNLACWCRLDGKACHADILLEIVNEEEGET